MAFLAKKAESDAEFCREELRLKSEEFNQQKGREVRRTKDDSTSGANVYSYAAANKSATSSCPTTTEAVTACLHAVPAAAMSAIC